MRRARSAFGAAAIAACLSTLTSPAPAQPQPPALPDAAPISLLTLLNEMVDREALARWPIPEYSCLQASSYDRASTDPSNPQTWFANADVSQYLRVETNGDRREWVLMDAPGPGAIVRVWSANPKGTLRVYLDGAATPAIEGTMSDILGGKWLAPDALSYQASKGWNLYLPVPFAKHCKVTSDNDGFYYQINYRQYAPATPVESFTAAALDAASESLMHVAGAMSDDRRTGMPPFSRDERGFINGGGIKPGETFVLDLPAGAHAVTGMMLRIDADDREQALRSCVVRAEFDGQECIWCPAGDFFGSGVGANSYQDWYRAVSTDGMMRCRWVMPYRRSAKFSVTNLGAVPVRADLRARVKPWAWDDRSMHFHAVWRAEYPVHAEGAKGTSDFNYVDIQGRGVYVGDVLSIMNPVKDWWGEGDEKIYVDAEKFPSHFGTGTEDYYGYAWCWHEVFHRPFHAQPRCDGQPSHNNWGRTTVTRSRSLDAIPFRTSLSMNMEVWHWKKCDVEYASTAYFYALPGAATNRPPMPDVAARPLPAAPPLPPPYKVKDAIECESALVAARTPDISVTPQGGFGPDLWSGGQQLWIQARQVGDFVELKIPAAGTARLRLYATRSWDYAIVRFTVNGQPAGPDVDLCSAKREVLATGPLDLGVFEPVGGVLLLRAEVVGSNPKSEKPQTFFGLDCITLQPAN